MSQFEHISTFGHVPVTLLLLHGTGGDERGLTAIGRELLPGASILSPRGQVNEGGANRWFKRFAEGIFDEDDMKAKASDLAEFVLEQRIDNPVVAIGYSNGANMGAALMTLHPEILSGLAMWRGMKIFNDDPQPSLEGKRVLMLNGTNDPFAPLASAQEQAQRFEQAKAETRLEILPTGHNLSSNDIQITQEWLSSWQK